MDEYIKKEKIFKMLDPHKSGDAVVGSVLLAVRKAVENLPADNVVEVAPGLRNTVKMLCKEYEKAKQTSYVRDPLAYALYQTWRHVDGRRGNGE